MSDITFNDTHCCIISEIDKLALFAGNPKEAMRSFCRQMIGQRMKFKGFTGNPDAMYACYMFSSAIYKANEDRYGASSRTVAKDGIHYVDYGTEFADFITENKLGTLIKTDILNNKAYHKDHYNRVWIWTVDVDAVKAWWAKEQVVIAEEQAEIARKEAERVAKLKAAEDARIKKMAEATAKANLKVGQEPTFKTVTGPDGKIYAIPSYGEVRF